MENRIDRLRTRLEECGCDAFFSLAAPVNQYLAGFRGSTSAFILTPSDAFFLCDFRYVEQARAEVRTAQVEQITGDLCVRVGERLAALGVKTAAFEPDYLTVAQLETIKTAYPGEPRAAHDLVSALRRLKTEDEIRTIEEALRLSESVLADILPSLKPGVSERETAARIEYEMKMRGAEAEAFDTIVLFGARSSLPHGRPDESRLAQGDIVLLDFGCRKSGYCSDLTRTQVFGSMPDAWFEEVYELVLTAQRIAIEAARPGMTCRELDGVARNLIAEAGYGEYFGHGLGHGLGIEIHETPRVNPQSEIVLEPGMVMTIEPGVYVPERGGVRIEDVIAVTSAGCTVLSRAPKEMTTAGG